MKMRRSRVLEKLRAGKLVSCCKLNVDSARVVELAAMQGFDCVWLDMEHTANDWSLVEKEIYAAKSWDCDTLVRVRRGCYSEYSVPLELDAAGLMVPHVMNRQDAERVVEMTRFAPLGKRAVDGGNADGAYCNVNFTDYIVQANEQRFIIAQIEDPEALEDIEGICSVEGIDMIFFGPGDYSVAIGVPGETDHPRVVEARKTVAQVAAKHGKFAGTTATPATFAERRALGYQFLTLGADVVGLANYFKEMLSVYRQNS